MNISGINQQAIPMKDNVQSEKPPVTVQNELEKGVLKENKEGLGANTKLNQTVSVLAATQPVQQIQQTAKNQISKGYLDVKV